MDSNLLNTGTDWEALRLNKIDSNNKNYSQHDGESLGYCYKRQYQFVGQYLKFQRVRVLSRTKFKLSSES